MKILNNEQVEEVEKPREEEDEVVESNLKVSASNLNIAKVAAEPNAPKVLMDAYGKHYAAIEDLVRARGKQLSELYENVEGLQVRVVTNTRNCCLMEGGNSSFEMAQP